MTTTPNQCGALPTAKWLTAVEAAQYLKIKVRTLLLWVRQGKVKGYALSGTQRRVWRFQQCDLDAMLTEPSVALESKRRIQ
jgi:excisionase family DNA binding protein